MHMMRPAALSAALALVLPLGCSSGGSADSGTGGSNDLGDGGPSTATHLPADPADTSSNPSASANPPDAPSTTDSATSDTQSAETEPEPGSPSDDTSDDGVVEEEDVLIESGDPLACEREVAFQAVLLNDPAPIDVVIVADHSLSLGWSKDDLSRGLSELLSNMSGRDARFFLLTPTQYDASSAASSRLSSFDVVQWKDPVTGEPYQNAVTRYSETCTDIDNQVIPCPEDPNSFEQPLTVDGRFEFVMPEALASISKDMTVQQIAAQQEIIKQAILALGANGAAYEQPLCTLGRYVAQAASELPERVVFLILSDEDDTSDPNECLTGLHYEKRRQPVEVSDCSAGCSSIRYWAFAPASRFWVSYTCIPTDDLGTPFPDQAVDGAFTYTTNDEDCSAGPDCTETNLQSTRNYCSPGAIIDSCERTCSTDPEDRVGCLLDLQDTEVDACSEPFQYGGVTYQSVPDFCAATRGEGNWGECERHAYSDSVAGTGGWTGGMSPQRLAVATTPAQLAEYVTRQVDTVFGADNYSIQLIAFRPEFECAPQAGQSYAENLATLTTPEGIFPICESYAPALERISGFAESTLQAAYEFELSDRETLEAVVVTDLAGDERTLDPSQYYYDYTAFRLTLDRGAITARDRELSVEIEIHCTAVVR